jgi:Holliday junction resolvase RusA-like endonuclease
MPYIGNCLSVNHYKFNGGKYTRPEVKEWMNDLCTLIANCKITDWKQPLKVTISCTFKNERSMCDSHNLIKIIADCVQEATGLNDKFYATETTKPVIDKTKDPFILIKIEELEPTK